MAASLPVELFWSSTLTEIRAVFKRLAERERAANMRAGLVASTIANVHRKKGKRPFRPTDFFRGPRRYMTVEQGHQWMRRWSERHNAQVERNGGNE